MENFGMKINQLMWDVYFKVQKVKNDTREALENKDGEAYIDTVVKILIAVVIGGVLFYAVYKIMGNADDSSSVIGRMKEKIDAMFNKTMGES